MYGISTEYKISYIDCLFLCVTSMTVNGLATVDLSTLSVMQQVIMFWQMLIGSLVSFPNNMSTLCRSSLTRQVFVSIVMIIVRQYVPSSSEASMLKQDVADAQALFPTQIQARHNGTTKAREITLATNTIAGWHHKDTTAISDQAAIQHHHTTRQYRG